jgi:hypothetical protein
MWRKEQPARNLLEMVPCRGHEWADGGAGRIKVLVPRYGASRLGRWVAARVARPHIPVNLDDVGSSVWRACDGRATVREIAERIEEEFGERIAPVHERLSKFFTEMERGRLIRWRET